MAVPVISVDLNEDQELVAVSIASTRGCPFSATRAQMTSDFFKLFKSMQCHI